MINKLITRLSLAFMLIASSACSTIITKPLKPTIELVSVVPLNISWSHQQLRFALRVINPNNFQLPVDSINFVAHFNDTNIASGKSHHSTVIPANGEALLMLDVTAGIDRLMTTLETLLEGESLNMNYDLTGTVKIENWATPVPFDVSGQMDIEKALEG